MNRKPAFTLMDALIALVITLTGTACMIRLSGVTEKQWRVHRERMIAAEILDRLATVDFDRLATWGDRSFDGLGRPDTGQKPVVYTLEVRTSDDLYWKTHICRLRYRDDDDHPVVLEMVRKEWLDHVQSI